MSKRRQYNRYLTKNNKSDYKHLIESAKEKTGYSEFLANPTFDRYQKLLNDLDSYFNGIPWEYVVRKAPLLNVIEDFMDSVIFSAKDGIIDYWKRVLEEKHLQRRYIRGDYQKILSYVIEHPDLIELYKEAPAKAYKEISDKTGYAKSTIAGAFTSFRNAGVLI